MNVNNSLPEDYQNPDYTAPQVGSFGSNISSFNNRLIGQPGSPQRTEMTLGAFGPLGMMLGMYLSNKQKAGREMTKAKDNVQNQMTDLNQWYNSEYYKDYLNSSEARSAMMGLQNQLNKVMSGVNNQGASTGATTEGRIAAKGEVQRNMADAINRLVGVGAQQKQGTRRDYMTYSGLINQQLNGMYQQQAQNYNQAADNIANAGSDMLGLLANAGLPGSGGFVSGAAKSTTGMMGSTNLPGQWTY